MPARRRLEFGTPARKRAKTSHPMVLYRGLRTEMKFFETNVPYSGVNQTVALINGVDATAVPTSTSCGRIGNKIKIHRIQAVIAQTSASGVVRVQFLLPKVAGTVPTPTFGGFVSTANTATLYEKYLHNGTAFASTGCNLNYKLPLGIVSYYDGNFGSTIRRNPIYIAVSTPTNESITINTRIWYTDA